jgi:ABC-type lipoprotein export system ATPase subunit
MPEQHRRSNHELQSNNLTAHNLGANHVLAKAEALSKSYRTSGGLVQALNGIDLEVRRGELVALVGPTGSGKTTLLMLLAGLEQADQGAVTLLDWKLDELSMERTTELRSHTVGIIYQQYNLFPGFTVRENVGLPLRLMLRPPYDAEQRANQLLDELKLQALANRMPDELSGGQQQMVAIARALAANPPLILADEPTANLDSSTARQIVVHLRCLADSGRHGVLLATHDLRTANQADRVLTLRDGKIVKETTLQAGRAPQEVLAELA